MYVRWKKRKQKDGTNMLDAVLVESYREGNKVKQRFIKNLASICAEISHEDLKYGITESNFMDTVRWRLDELDLSEREKIEGMARKKFQNTIKCSA